METGEYLLRPEKQEGPLNNLAFGPSESNRNRSRNHPVDVLPGGPSNRCVASADLPTYAAVILPTHRRQA